MKVLGCWCDESVFFTILTLPFERSLLGGRSPRLSKEEFALLIQLTLLWPLNWFSINSERCIENLLVVVVPGGWSFSSWWKLFAIDPLLSFMHIECTCIWCVRIWSLTDFLEQNIVAVKLSMASSATILLISYQTELLEGEEDVKDLEMSGLKVSPIFPKLKRSRNLILWNVIAISGESPDEAWFFKPVTTSRHFSAKCFRVFNAKLEKTSDFSLILFEKIKSVEQTLNRWEEVSDLKWLARSPFALKLLHELSSFRSLWASW